MRRLIKTEWKKIRLLITGTILLMTVAMTILCCTLYKGYSILYALEAWELGTEIFDIIIPLLVVIPLCWSLYYERKDNWLLYAGARVPLRKYLEAKWCVQAVSAFAICFVPYFFSAVITVHTVSFTPTFDNYAVFRHVFQSAFTQTPILYALTLSAWKGVIGIIIISLGFVLSMYISNIFIILTGPFVYSVLENFAFSILGAERFRLVTAFRPSSLDARVITPASFLTGPAVLLLVTVLSWLVCAKVKKLHVLEV